MISFVTVLELIGTVAFSVSGAMIGIRKNMDIFGVMTLGLITAVGGGVIRDLTLGITPPATFRNPIYAVTAIITAVIIFLPAMQRLLNRFHSLYDIVMLWMDSLGLGIFTVVGVQAAFSHSSDYGIFLLIFVGIITGVGGGILRDVLAGLPPYIFVKHIYACASLVGAVFCSVLWRHIPSSYAMAIGAGLVMMIRLLSAHFRWSLPKARSNNSDSPLDKGPGI